MKQATQHTYQHKTKDQSNTKEKHNKHNDNIISNLD